MSAVQLSLCLQGGQCQLTQPRSAVLSQNGVREGKRAVGMTGAIWKSSIPRLGPGWRGQQGWTEVEVRGAERHPEVGNGQDLLGAQGSSGLVWHLSAPPGSRPSSGKVMFVPLLLGS